MINVSKSNNIPECLSIDRVHTCCVEQLQTEFLGKCYICENKDFTTIQTDHFDPNPALRLDWYNLFFSCGHCNGIKSNKYIGMLKCTDFSVIITDVIQFYINPLPKETPKFTSLKTDVATKTTVDLLNDVHNPSTKTRSLEANVLNELICTELIEFSNKILKYYNSSIPQKKVRIKNDIKEMLHSSSKFVAYKIWLIKSDIKRLNDFQDILPTFVN